MDEEVDGEEKDGGEDGIFVLPWLANLNMFHEILQVWKNKNTTLCFWTSKKRI